MNNLIKNMAIWLVIALVLMTVFQTFSHPAGGNPQETTYSSFLSEVDGERGGRGLRHEPNPSASLSTPGSEAPASGRAGRPR